MADVDDQWHKLVDGRKVRTEKYGRGKRWRARWRDESGIQRQESFDTKADADRHVATVKADMLRKTYIDPNAGKVTFRDYAERWRAAQVHAPGTRQQIETHFRRHVYPVLGDKPMASIRRSDAQAWVRGMEVGTGDRAALMPATVQVIYRYVVAVGYAAVGDKVIALSPFVKLARTKPTKKRVSPPTGEMLTAMYGNLPPRFRALVTVGAGAGVRQGEAFALEVDSIDFLRRRIHIRQQLLQLPNQPVYLALPKGGKTRTVPAADAFLLELSRHLKEFPATKVYIEDRTVPAKPRWRWAEFVFTTVDGLVLRRTGVGARLWRPARASAGLPVEFTFHDLRHYFASALIRYGESVKTVQAALGHATAAETLDTYSHLWPDSEDRTRAAIDAAFKADVGDMWVDLHDGSSKTQVSGL